MTDMRDEGPDSIEAAVALLAAEGRGTGYDKIIRAVFDAAAEMRANGS